MAITPLLFCHDKKIKKLYADIYERDDVKQLVTDIKLKKNEMDLSERRHRKNLKNSGLSYQEISKLEFAILGNSNSKEIVSAQELKTIAASTLGPGFTFDDQLFDYWSAYLINSKKYWDKYFTLYNAEKRNYLADISGGGVTVDSAVLKKTEATFLEAKNGVIDFLQEKKDQLGNEAFRNMMDRVSTLTYKVASSPGSEEYSNCGSTENAFYNPLNHTIYLCPNLGENTKSNLVFVFAHEIAHSFDPCTLASDFLEVKAGSKLKSADDAFKLSSREIPKFVNDMTPLTPEAFSIFDSIKTNQLHKGIPYSQNPFSSQLNCLVGSNSLGAKVATKARIKDEIKASGEDKITVKHQLEALEHSYDRFKGCSYYPGASQVGEAFADFVGSNVLDQYLEKLPPEKRKRSGYESLVFFLKSSCDYSKSPEYTKLTATASEMNCPEAEKAITRLAEFQSKMKELIRSKGDEHSDSSDRIFKLLLTSPTMEKTMGCKGTGDYCGK